MASRRRQGFSIAAALCSATALVALSICAWATSPTRPASAAKTKKKQCGRGYPGRRDLDGDGVPNRRDRDVDGDGVRNGRDRDVDGDRVRNGRDRDVDGDGLRNGCDRDVDGDGLRNGCRDQDTDGDGRRNGRDRDVDGDGRRNGRDPDVDGDGIPNRRDADANGDCIPDRRRSLVLGGKVPPGFFGLVTEDTFALDGPALATDLARIRGSGAGTISKVFHWSEVERVPGVYDFRAYDSQVEAATRNGLSVVGTLFDPPWFRSTAPLWRPANRAYPPRDFAAFASFAAAVVRRYGSSGSFWDEHPELPRRPVHIWQVWNEPNVPAYWASGPDPEAYTEMLKRAYAAIKWADRSAEVASGGLTDSELGMPLESFLSRMYAAGARGSFDSLGLHPYAVSSDGVLDIVARVRQLMDGHGDQRVPIRITEVGWGTAGPANQVLNVGPAAQAGLIRSTLRRLVERRKELGIKGVIYYSWRDLPPFGNQRDFWGLHAGLIDQLGNWKPGYLAYRETVRGWTESDSPSTSRP
jgi:hypothetical protein